MKKYLVFVVMSFLLVACDNNQSTSVNNQESEQDLSSSSVDNSLQEQLNEDITVIDNTIDIGISAGGADNSQNSLDYDGSYSGEIFFDNHLIAIKLALDDNSLEYVYEDGEQLKVGNYSWTDLGNIIELDDAGKVFLRFLVGEGQLILVDNDDKQIIDSSGQAYLLMLKD